MLEQTDSPLFCLPTELRLRIYWYVFAAMDVPVRPLRYNDPSSTESRHFLGLLLSSKRATNESKGERRSAISWLMDIQDFVGGEAWVADKRKHFVDVRVLTVQYRDVLKLRSLSKTIEVLDLLSGASHLSKLTVRMSDDAWSSDISMGETGGSWVLRHYQALAAEQHFKLLFESVESCRTW